MNMVRHSIDHKRPASDVIDNPADVSVQLAFDFRNDEVLPVLGTKNRM